LKNNIAKRSNRVDFGVEVCSVHVGFGFILVTSGRVIVTDQTFQDYREPLKLVATCCFYLRKL